MQSINDDMDELYRKAAENYPLKTDGANWDKVLQQMQEDTPVVDRGTKKGRFLWLLLLLPMFFVCNRYWGNKFFGGKQMAENRSVTKEDKTGGLVKNGLEKPDLVEKENTKNKANLTGDINKMSTNKEERNDFKLLTSQEFLPTSITKTKWNRREDNSLKTYLNSSTVDTKKTSAINIGENKKTANKIGEPGVVERAATSGVENSKELSAAPDSAINNNEIAKNTVDSLQQTISSTSQQPTSTVLEKKQQQKKKRPNFYYGLLAGADVSTVKLQKTAGIGYNFGLIGGYTLNARWSIEAGFMLNNKKYYSKGKYFDAKSMNWPMHTELLRIDGYCNMYEIPVNIRYDWKVNGGTKLFATAGTSSYLMSKESYNYDLQRYGMPYSGSRSYNNSTKDWFSVINFSAGYQKNLGKIGDLRIEPYLKIPVSGLGIGSMPITSTGVNFGLTRPLR